MKLRIAETVPGELVSRAVEAVRVIERITGRALLGEMHKASQAAKDEVAQQIDQSPAQFEYPVLLSSVKRSGREVERIRKLMVKKMDKVLD